MNYKFDNSIGKLSRQAASGIGIIITNNFKEKGFDYDSKDWMYISFIKNTKNISQNDLGKNIGFNKVMINRGIERLEKLDVVLRTKDKYDNRVKRLSLSKKGKTLYNNMKVVVENSLVCIFKGVDEDKKKQCVEVLELALKNIEKEGRF